MSQLIVACTCQQNKVLERKNKTIFNKVQTMLISENISLFL
uniref:Uncharacterized protein n=1 Tax=Physcomitrium patens TaxID=3218 RepID=A0A2K1JTZ9_PHYPA|nr:hypothetical protein PHYPA_014774 [Physcomitrium patens]